MSDRDQQLAAYGVPAVEATILTASGHYFNLRGPELATIEIEDIAHALSNQCLYGGHTREFISVAQLSTMAAGLLAKRSKQLAYVALLGLSTNAYLGTMRAPLKRLVPEYELIAKPITAAIREKFRVANPVSIRGLPIARAYQAVLAEVFRQQFPKSENLHNAPEFQRLVNPTQATPIPAWTPDEARSAFLHAFDSLKTSDATSEYLALDDAVPSMAERAFTAAYLGAHNNPTAIVTQSGKTVCLDDPDADTLNADDIVHALSHLCRFTGHTRAFYSVLDHSLHVADQLMPDEALGGLLHDGAEAFLGDVATPLKQLLPSYKRLEANFERVLLAKYGLPERLPRTVKAADLVMLATERRDFCPNDATPWGLLSAVAPLSLRLSARPREFLRALFEDQLTRLVEPNSHDQPSAPLMFRPAA